MEKIMFNDRYGLNQAVLDRRKTNTRRIVPERLFQECRSNAWIEAGGFNAKWKEKALALMLKSSPYKVGDVVAVAQSYSQMRVNDMLAVQEETGERFLLEKFKASKGWSNKMFVAAKYMPHRIRITNVRLERLQDISDEDCLKEGIEFAKGGYYTNYNKETNSRNSKNNEKGLSLRQDSRTTRRRVPPSLRAGDHRCPRLLPWRNGHYR